MSEFWYKIIINEFSKVSLSLNKFDRHYLGYTTPVMSPLVTTVQNLASIELTLIVLSLKWRFGF